MKKEILKDIPAEAVLERRFAFLKEEILRTNVVIAFRYIIFLITLQEKLKFRSGIAYSIYKDIILYVASIVESCIHYTLQEFFNAGLIKKEDVMPSEWQEIFSKEIYKISDMQIVCGIIKEKKCEEFSKKTQFLIINRTAKKAGILTDGLFKRAEALRKKRNKIHLVGLEMADDYYDKTDIKSSFRTAKVILTHLEEKLKEITN